MLWEERALSCIWLSYSVSWEAGSQSGSYQMGFPWRHKAVWFVRVCVFMCMCEISDHVNGEERSCQSIYLTVKSTVGLVGANLRIENRFEIWKCQWTKSSPPTTLPGGFYSTMNLASTMGKTKKQNKLLDSVGRGRGDNLIHSGNTTWINTHPTVWRIPNGVNFVPFPVISFHSLDAKASCSRGSSGGGGLIWVSLCTYFFFLLDCKEWPVLLWEEPLGGSTEGRTWLCVLFLKEVSLLQFILNT